MPGDEKTIFATTHKTWELINPSGEEVEIYILPAGRHELERIPNPLGHQGDFLVLKGTKIGQSEGAWRQWHNGEIITAEDHPNFGRPVDWGDYAIEIEE